MIDAKEVSLKDYRISTVNGESTEAYNDIAHTGVALNAGEWKPIQKNEYCFEPHSVNVIQFR